jgi:hypothetical protein
MDRVGGHLGRKVVQIDTKIDTKKLDIILNVKPRYLDILPNAPPGMGGKLEVSQRGRTG